MNAGRIGGLSFIWPGIWVKRLERGPDGEWRLYDLEVTTALELRDLSPAFLGVDVEAAGIFSAGSAIGASIVGAVGGAIGAAEVAESDGLQVRHLGHRRQAHVAERAFECVNWGTAVDGK